MSQPPSPASSGPSTCVLQLTWTNGDARLDQPAGDQAALAEPVRPVGLADPGRLATRRRGPPGSGARRSACAPARNAAPAARAGAGRDRRRPWRRASRSRSQRRPEPRGVDALGECDVGQLQARRPARSRAGTGRSVLPERPAPLADGPLQPLMQRVAQDDVRRQRTRPRAGAAGPTIAPVLGRMASVFAAPPSPTAPAMLPVRAIVPAIPWSFDSWCIGPQQGELVGAAGQARAAARRRACPGPPWRSARTARGTRPGRRASCRTCRGGSARPRARARSPPAPAAPASPANAPGGQHLSPIAADPAAPAAPGTARTIRPRAPPPTATKNQPSPVPSRDATPDPGHDPGLPPTVATTTSTAAPIGSGVPDGVNDA